MAAAAPAAAERRPATRDLPAGGAGLRLRAAHPPRHAASRLGRRRPQARQRHALPQAADGCRRRPAGEVEGVGTGGDGERDGAPGGAAVAVDVRVMCAGALSYRETDGTRTHAMQQHQRSANDSAGPKHVTRSAPLNPQPRRTSSPASKTTSSSAPVPAVALAKRGGVHAKGPRAPPSEASRGLRERRYQAWKGGGPVVLHPPPPANVGVSHRAMGVLVAVGREEGVAPRVSEPVALHGRAVPVAGQAAP